MTESAHSARALASPRLRLLRRHAGRRCRLSLLNRCRHRSRPPRVLRPEPWPHNSTKEPCHQPAASRTRATRRPPQTVSASHLIKLAPMGHLNAQYSRLWLLGFAIFISSNILGSFFQIASLPVVILAPLGAVSLLWNAFFARFLASSLTYVLRFVPNIEFSLAWRCLLLVDAIRHRTHRRRCCPRWSLRHRARTYTLS